VTDDARILLDEHVSRIFENVLSQRGYVVEQAKDRFGEETDDEELLRWCGDNGFLLVTNNAVDFVSLHRSTSHAGLLLYREQSLPDCDPEGMSRAVEEIIEQYGTDGVRDELVTLDEWYDWIQE
jgi:predicted nuclease of predicted toxin-antitoxin system